MSALERTTKLSEQRIPRADGDFATWAEQHFESVEKFWSVNGLDGSDLTPLEKARSAWLPAYTKSVQAQAALDAALEAKRDARAKYESAIRPVSAFIQTFFKTTDADRATIGITVRDTSGTPTKAPATRPQVSIKLADRLQHTLRITDEATPLRRARPEGVMGCEVWMKLVDYSQTLPQRDGTAAPQPSDERALIDPFLGDPATFRFLGVATRTPHITKFPLEARGKSAVYMLRWVSTRGTPGPWSDIASATVAA